MYGGEMIWISKKFVKAMLNKFALQDSFIELISLFYWFSSNEQNWFDIQFIVSLLTEVVAYFSPVPQFDLR